MRTTRRMFMKSALAAGFPAIVPASVFGKNAPSNRFTLGVIGTGIQGMRANLRAFLNQPDARVVWVCDVFKSRSLKARQTVDGHYGDKGCRACQDFREIINDKSVDAVVISTPDHWHVPISLMALEAGKDVFSEKPTYTIEEGRLLVDAVRKRGAVFQAGIEDRSLMHYHKMVEWVRNGEIGGVERVEVTIPVLPVYPAEKPAPVPGDLNWEMFIGPADFIPYTPNLSEARHWRMVRNFSGGMLLDWGSHLVDTAQLAVNDGLPVEVSGTGFIPENAMTNVPQKLDVRYRYAGGSVVHVKTGGTGIRIYGSKGWVGNDAWMDQLKASDKKILHTKYAPGKSRHWALPPSEQRNFLDCMKSRKPATYSAEVLCDLCTTLHMGLISIYRGEKLRWDPAAWKFIGNPAANAMMHHTPREDWKKKA